LCAAERSEAKNSPPETGLRREDRFFSSYFFSYSLENEVTPSSSNILLDVGNITSPSTV